MRVQPNTIRAEAEMLDDLRQRLRRTRSPDQPGGPGWPDVTDLAYLQELVVYWEHTFNWRAQESRSSAPGATATARSSGASEKTISCGS
jgi:hypothetical protein